MTSIKAPVCEVYNEEGSTVFVFKTEAEMEAFIFGVEFVNDSALEIIIEGPTQEKTTKEELTTRYVVRIFDREA
jgi:hypothetical protein